MGILDGKAVVITGAGRGLGRAYARHAAGRGASVLVNDVDVATAHAVVAKIQAAGGTEAAHGGSVADPAQAESLISQWVARFGAIDGGLRSAGPWRRTPRRTSAIRRRGLRRRGGSSRRHPGCHPDDVGGECVEVGGPGQSRTCQPDTVILTGETGGRQ
ncbi:MULTISPECIES: SDR family NAD(P)-dependent oxidoreductase [Actinoalloteichus]|uniref:SDR family NAD(P)-dependent oxidoreductase n=1 Tax=Actinoalloteichus TaxID=65496 RepID=UPI00095339BC|nr:MULTISPECIES: SDR family NAD(P)-dependent oxidoreductase [Actinoalloteichus]